MATSAQRQGINEVRPSRGLERQPFELVVYALKAACWTMPAWLVASLAGYAASMAVIPTLPAPVGDFATSWVGSPAWYGLIATGAAAFLFATFSLNFGRLSCSLVVAQTSLGTLAAACVCVAGVLAHEVPGLAPADLAWSSLALGASLGSALALPLVMGLLHGLPSDVLDAPLMILQGAIGLAGVGLCLLWYGLGHVVGMLFRAMLVTIGILVALELLDMLVFH